MSFPRPHPDALVRLVMADGRRIVGHVIDAKTMSGRWPVVLLGSNGKNAMIDPSDVVAVEPVDALARDQIDAIVEKQRADADPKKSRSRTTLSAAAAPRPKEK